MGAAEEAALAAHVQALADERDALRAEVETLTKERDEARAGKARASSSRRSDTARAAFLRLETHAHSPYIERGKADMPARARVASVAPEALRLLLEFRSSATSYQASEIDAVLRKAGVVE